MTRSPRLCRLGLHKYRRRPRLDAATDGGDTGLTWHMQCDRCDAYRDRFTKGAST